MARTGTLARREQRALAALMAAPSIEAAAAGAGLGVRTVKRYLSRPAFATALREAQAEALAATVRRLTIASGDAVSVLASTLADADAGRRLRAADLVLSKLPGLAALGDLETRLAALESATMTRGGET